MKIFKKFINKRKFLEKQFLFNATINVDEFSFDGTVTYAKVVNIVDGDTIDCVFYVMSSVNNKKEMKKFRIRMASYDAPEMRPRKSKYTEDERQYIIMKANEAKDMLYNLIGDSIVILECGKYDNFGRILGTIKHTVDSTNTINQMMIDSKCIKENQLDGFTSSS